MLSKLSTKADNFFRTINSVSGIFYGLMLLNAVNEDEKSTGNSLLKDKTKTCKNLDVSFPEELANVP